METRALKNGCVLKGEKHSYEICGLLRVDGMGFTYKAAIVNPGGDKMSPEYVVIREHFMPHCSSRGADGMVVETPEEIAPTVQSCLASFEKSSHDRMKVSSTCSSIIDVYEVFPANNTFYYVVEFLDGPTLDEVVKEKGSLSYQETKEILSPIFQAARAMHSYYLVHNTIHPRHIRFLNQNGKLYPVLFSLYSTIGFDDQGLRQWTLPVMSCEDGFAPPELYSSMDHFSPAIDIYSLAATIVFCLSGRTLPPAPEITEEIVRTTLPADTPETRVQAILNALNPDPSQRTQSVTIFREELSGFYNKNQRKTRQEIKEEKEPEDWKDTLKQYQYPIALIIAAIVAVIILSFF